MSNYKLILDEKVLEDFIAWLPELEQGEVFYLTLLARAKYWTGMKSSQSDFTQLKRFTCDNKDFLVDKIRQLECVKGAYKVKGKEIPNNALAIYIMPNPRSLKKAQNTTLIELAKRLGNAEIVCPKKTAMTAIQTSKSRTVYVDFDFDRPHDLIGEVIEREVNEKARTTIITRGGFHLLVEPSKIMNNTWHKDITDHKYHDQVGDLLIPVPGTSQGGFMPYFKI